MAMASFTPLAAIADSGAQEQRAAVPLHGVRVY